LATEKIEESRLELQYKEGIEVKQLLHLDRVDLSLSGYEGYPSQTYDDENAVIIIEGLVYDKSEVEVRALLRQIVDDYRFEGFRKRVTEFIESCDGDYVVLIYFKKDGTIAIFNDRFGRLPAFFLTRNEMFAFSREIKFLLQWIPSIEFNRIALTEFLMQGYNLGDKTLLKGVKQMNAATLLEVRRLQNQTCVSGTSLLREDFTTMDRHLSREETLRRCVDLFRESVSVRVKKAQEKGLRIVADLSGGYDTRGIFAALCQTGAPFTSCTNVLITDNESHVAQSVADLFGTELLIFQAYHPINDLDVVYNVTYTIDCMTDAYSAVASYHDVLERMKTLTGPQARFMGFGGGLIRHPLRLRRHYRNLIEMLMDGAYAPTITGYLDPPLACAMMKIDRRDFLKNLEYEVGRFPERDDLDKIKHLSFNWYRREILGGGENRHRLFSWTVQPYWGKNLITFVMKDVPPGLLSYRFFIDFLRLLDGRTVKARIFGSQVRLDSSLSIAVLEIKTKVQQLVGDDRYLRNLYKWLIHRLAPSQDEKYGGVDTSITDRRQLIDELWKLFGSSKIVCEYFDRASIQKFLQGSPNTRQVYQLLTLMSYMAQVENRFPEKVLCADDKRFFVRDRAAEAIFMVSQPTTRIRLEKGVPEATCPQQRNQWDDPK